ncbi:hypothetical protein HaLaN_13118, partial [Haematococcus lacustris]
LLDRLPEALVQASSSAPGIMSVSSYTKGSSTSLQMDEDASYPSIAAALVAPLDSPRPTSPSLLNAAMYNSNGGRPHMAMQRPTPTQLLEVGDADEQKPSSSKYGKLFAKMWGHGGSGKAGASSADIEAFRVQGSPGSSSGKHSAVGVLRAQPGHRNLKEELLADREQSIVVLDRNGSVIGAPTMTFKQPSAAALQALRANLASGAAALPTAADNRANLLTAKFHNDLNPVGRMTSEAVLLRHGIDRGVGRSFTGANSPTMKKMANAPLVSKIHDFVQNK